MPDVRYEYLVFVIYPSEASSNRVDALYTVVFIHPIADVQSISDVEYIAVSTAGPIRSVQMVVAHSVMPTLV
jgi:hypothetical protein